MSEKKKRPIKERNLNAPVREDMYQLVRHRAFENERTMAAEVRHIIAKAYGYIPDDNAS